MKEIDKRQGIKSNQVKSSRRTERRENKLHQDNSSKKLSEKGIESKTPQNRPVVNNLISDSNTASENSETYEDVVIHYVDDANRSEEALVEMKVNAMVSNGSKNEVLDNHSSDLEKEQKEGNEEVSDTDTIKDSVSISSQGDSFTNDDDKVEKVSKDTKSKVKVNPESNRGSRERSDRKTNKLQSKVSDSNQKKTISSNKGSSRVTNKNTLINSNTAKVPVKVSSESSEGVDEKPVQEVKEVDILDRSSNGAQSVASEDESHETVNTEENAEHEEEAASKLKIGEMELRIEKLEEELREVAALEVSLYSVVPEHGSSAHKVHTPARRLSRLYIHASKHWTLNSRATIAKNTVSGLILVAKACGNDVSRYIEHFSVIFLFTDFEYKQQIFSYSFAL